MVKSRPAKTLLALLGAMLLGSAILLIMDRAPIRSTGMQVTAAAGLESEHARAVNELDVRLRPAKWRHLVVHSRRAATAEAAARCHFLIHTDEAGHARVQTTDLWRKQTEGEHIFVPGHDYQADSIGVCVIGEFSRRLPTRDQFNALIVLVRALQARCDIDHDRVYLARDLSGPGAGPGEAFPAEAFNARLLRLPGR